MRRELSSMEIKRKLFGELCSQAVKLIAIHTNKRIGEVDDEWKTAIGKAESATNIINKYKSGQSLPNDPTRIDWLLEHGVNDGLLGKDWVISICKCLGYYNDDLIQKLFDKTDDTTSLVIKPLNSYLPPSSYKHFVERSILKDIAKELDSSATVILVKSIGGNGKTCIALEIAKRCISLRPEHADFPKFTSVIWISGKENTLGTKIKVLDSIAQSLGFTDILKYSYEEKNRKITEILRTNRMLLVIDNYETIEDKSDLSEWLLTMPSPSKCIVTTQAISENFNNAAINGGCKIYRLKGMSQDEAKILIQNKAKDWDLYIGNIAVFYPLIEKVEGNPKAIEVALGIMKQKEQTLDESVNILLDIGQNFMKDLFDLSWQWLNEEEKKLLEILALFPYGTDKQTLSKISRIFGTQLNSGLSKLIDLSLLNSNHKTTEIYYYLHSLVREYSAKKFEENLNKVSIIGNWMDAYIELTEKVSHCYGEANTEDLKVLDKDGLKEGLEYVVGWAMENKKYDFVIRITDNVKYYFYIRGIWASQLNILRAKAASENSDIQAEFDAYVYHLNILCKQENIKEIDYYLPIINQLKEKQENELTQESLIDFQHDIALYFQMQEDFKEAIKLRESNLKKINDLIIKYTLEQSQSTVSELQKIENKIKNLKRQLNTNKRWLGIVYFKDKNFEKAKEHLREIANEIYSEKYCHNSLSAFLHICKINSIEKDEDTFDNISLGFLKSKESKDNFHQAEFEFLLAKYHLINGNRELSEIYFNEAITSFERIGCISRISNVRTYMKELML